MGLEKAIKYKKEYRKAYRGAKAIDCSCRNHGSCNYCKNNRLHNAYKKEYASKEQLKDESTNFD